MKKLINITLTVIPIAAGVLQACGQNDGPPNGDGRPPYRHRPPPPPLLLALDTNRDGIIGSNEIANASAELLALDKNGDGQLTSDEYLPPRPAHADGGFRPPPLPLIEVLDVNHDGVIDANEIANAPAELKTLDRNGDGKLTRAEYCPPPPRDRGNRNSSDGHPPDDENNSGPPGPPENY